MLDTCPGKGVSRCPTEPVRKEGLEPSRPFGHTPLKRARLPIPPHPPARLHSTSSRRRRGPPTIASVPKRAVTSVWISIDMEGIGGVATDSHVMMQGIEYERARQCMTHEANACIDGAASAGARRICVNDSHGAMHNIFADDLDPRAELVVGTAKPWSMGQGIDGGYDTCFFVGYHGRAGHPKAVLARRRHGEDEGRDGPLLGEDAASQSRAGSDAGGRGTGHRHRDEAEAGRAQGYE